jgi:ATP synthase F1 delta subunit
MSKPFEELLLERNNTVKATVTSVVALTEADLASVSAKIEEIVGKKVLVEQVVDTSILGGLVVRVGNNILDLSLRNKLDTMTKTAIS